MAAAAAGGGGGSGGMVFGPNTLVVPVGAACPAHLCLGAPGAGRVGLVLGPGAAGTVLVFCERVDAYNTAWLAPAPAGAALLLTLQSLAEAQPFVAMTGGMAPDAVFCRATGAAAAVHFRPEACEAPCSAQGFELNMFVDQAHAMLAARTLDGGTVEYWGRWHFSPLPAAPATYVLTPASVNPPAAAGSQQLALDLDKSGDKLILYPADVAKANQQWRVAASFRLPAPAAPLVRILHMSDTHMLHRSIEATSGAFPAADILVHTGDFTNMGTDAELDEFNAWLGELKPRFPGGIVVINGNHVRARAPRPPRPAPPPRPLIRPFTRPPPAACPAGARRPPQGQGL